MSISLSLSLSLSVCVYVLCVCVCVCRNSQLYISSSTVGKALTCEHWGHVIVSQCYLHGLWRIFAVQRIVAPLSYVISSLTHSLTHWFSHSLASSLDRSLTHSVTHSLTRLVTHSLTHSVTHSLDHSITHSLTHMVTHLVTHSVTHSFTLSLSRSPTHSHTLKQHAPYQNNKTNTWTIFIWLRALIPWTSASNIINILSHVLVTTKLNITFVGVYLFKVNISTLCNVLCYRAHYVRRI